MFFRSAKSELLWAGSLQSFLTGKHFDFGAVFGLFLFSSVRNYSTLRSDGVRCSLNSHCGPSLGTGHETKAEESHKILSLNGSGISGEQP